MSRKAFGLSAFAIVAGASLTLASAEFSGAVAQNSDLTVDDAVASGDLQAESGNAPMQPVFVSQEVVQPLDETADESAQTAELEASTLRELVGKIDTDVALSEQMRCLAQTVYFESRGEPLAGQLAVAQVVINRSDSARFPASYCGVVRQRAQFSFVKNGNIPTPKTGSRAWERAKAIARIAHEGLWESEAQDSLYFHAKYVKPGWSRKKVARATISTHIFYR